MRIVLNSVLAFVNLYIVVCYKDDKIIGYGIVIRNRFFEEERQEA